MASYSDKHPDELRDIALYAGYGADAIRHAQEQLRKFAGFLGADGAFLSAAADMLADAIHDEIDPALHMAAQAIESGEPQLALIAAHREAAIEARRA
jgi:hypothetical protein